MRIAKAIVSLLAALPVAGVAAGWNALLDHVQADHAALLAAEQDFRQRRDAGELSTAAAADYASYLDALRERVVADCQALLRAGDVVPGSPCAGFAISPLQASPVDQGVPLNRAERTSILDAELEAGLGEFDELLLREQARVRASAPRSGGDSGAAGSEGGSGSGQKGSAGDSGLAGTAGGAGLGSSGSDSEQGQDVAGSSPVAGQGSEGAASRSGTLGQPPGIPDGSDDDVVARQLREAAQKETDPALQKKLWEEYRRYKQGIR